MNELINVSAFSTTGTIEFKDPRLTEATQQIRRIYLDAAAYADGKNKEIAKILGRIKTQSLYKADGYASVADYADKVFGIKKANAYSLASAGEMYNNHDIGDTVKEFSPSKLAELAVVSNTHIKDAVKSGAIKPTDTQQTLREYASKFKASKSSKVNVMKAYTIRISGAYIDIPDQNDPRIMDDWDKHISDCMSQLAIVVEEVKLPKSTASPNSHPVGVQRKLYIWYTKEDTDYRLTMISYVPYVAAKPEAPATKVSKTAIDLSSLSIEDLEKLLAEKRGVEKAHMAVAYSVAANPEGHMEAPVDIPIDTRVEVKEVKPDSKKSKK